MVSPQTPPTTAPKPQAPGQASSPMGQSPATQMTQNRGAQAQAIQQISVAIKQLEQALQGVGSASDMGKSILEALTKLTKIAPAGSTTPAGERNAMQSAQLQQAQNNQAMQRMMAMRQQGQGAAQGGQGAAQQAPAQGQAA